MATSLYHPKHSTPLHTAVARSNKATSTKQIYYRALDRFVDAIGADPEGWTRENFQRFYDGLIADGMKPQSANTVYMALRSALKLAERADNSDPTLSRIRKLAEIDLSEPENILVPRALTYEEANRLVATCADLTDPEQLRDQTLVIFALETGAEAMTLVGCRWENLATDPNTLTAPLRGGTSYKITLTRRAFGALMRWRAFCAARGITSGPIFCATSAGRLTTQPLTENGLWRTLKRRGDAAGLTNIHVRTLRHTMITWWLQHGKSALEVMSILGNAVETVLLIEADLWEAQKAQKARTG